MNQFANTLSPLNIRDLVIPNRIVFPPTVTGYSDSDGFVTGTPCYRTKLLLVLTSCPDSLSLDTP